MGNAMDTEEGTDNYSSKSLPTEVSSSKDFQHLTQNATGPTTLITAESGQKNPGASQNQVDQNPLIGVPIYVFHGDKCVFQPLNVPARNEIAHRSPALLKHAVAKAFQRQANKEGLYEDTDCVVRWKPSAIPFHIEFEISASNNTCQHLASVRNVKAKDPVSTRLHALPTSLTETEPVRKESCPTCKGFLKQATCKSTVMKPLLLPAWMSSLQRVRKATYRTCPSHALRYRATSGQTVSLKTDEQAKPYSMLGSSMINTTT